MNQHEITNNKKDLENFSISYAYNKHDLCSLKSQSLGVGVNVLLSALYWLQKNPHSCKV